MKHVGETSVDAATRQTIDSFLHRLKPVHGFTRAVLFGSRARGGFHDESDADLMIVFPGKPTKDQDKLLNLRLDLADMAFDTLLETGVRIQAVPLWEAEWTNRQAYSNPALLEDIAADGVVVA